MILIYGQCQESGKKEYSSVYFRFVFRNYKGRVSNLAECLHLLVCSVAVDHLIFYSRFD